MTRAFRPDPIESAVLDGLLDRARRAPSAGNTASLDFLVLEGSDQTEQYWSTTMTPQRRAVFSWPGLFAAPALVIPWVDPDAYVRRYGESDKAHSGLGDSADDWPVPYWFVDGGAAVMSLLLGAEAAGLGALLFGLFDHEAAVRDAFGVPEGRRAVGTIALGHADNDRPSQSAGRARRPLAEVVHRGAW